MKRINKKIKEYIEQEILPVYEKNDAGHGIEHIQYVVTRSLKFAEQFPDINLDMVYAIASFHDIAHYIDKDNHEVLSAKMFYENNKMKDFFDDEQRKIIKEAIEDHRASLEYEPRSTYGKIISSADRTTSIEMVLKRTHAYSLKHYPDFDLIQMIKRCYNHLLEKYGKGGYAKHYCYDEEYQQFKKDIDTILKDKWAFVKKYMEVNHIVNLKEKAKLFVINAHWGQIRKGEPDKPMIMHPFSVGKVLEEYGYDDNVVVAGYLHDVIEDTKYTFDDIKEEFGEDVAHLVKGASEPDKSLSWEERKQHTISETKKLSLRNKVIICADKIDNLEDLMIKFQKSGQRDFSPFKRGEEQQKWYYTSVYESLVAYEDEELPIFKRLRNVLDVVFNAKEDLYLKNTIFVDNEKYYETLKRLHAQKSELQKLKNLVKLSKPFVIEFSGTPRTGKTTIINNLNDFLKKGGFKTTIVDEFTTSKYYKEEFKEQYKGANSVDLNVAIIEEITKQLKNAISSDKEIILIDRSINDRQIWNYRLYARGDMDDEQYQDLKEEYRLLSKDLIDFLVITYADPLTSLKRDYLSSLALEKRKFLNIENLEEYNRCLEALKELFNISVGDMILLDTTLLTLNESSCEVASQLLSVMRRKYIEVFKQRYDLK